MSASPRANHDTSDAFISLRDRVTGIQNPERLQAALLAVLEDCDQNDCSDVVECGAVANGTRRAIAEALNQSTGRTSAPSYVVTWAVQHQRDHGDHGTNCACADDMIRRVRDATTVAGARDWSHTPGRSVAIAAQHRVDYILTAAQRRH